MTQNDKRACVFGGTGFAGRLIVRDLARAGYTVKVITRIPERAYFLKPYGNVGQIVPMTCDYTEGGLQAVVRGCDVVVNCIGVLYEKNKQSFQKVHHDIPQKIAAACAAAGVARFIHFSALGVDKATSRYAQSKRAGEEAVKAVFSGVTIFRPSVMFGPEDNFFNLFARLAMVVPALPLIGGGNTRLQPVYVGDVVGAVMAAIINPATQGRIYELGGPEVLTFKEIYQRIFAETGRTRCLVSLPFPLAKVVGSFLSVLPAPLLTADQVETLKTDNIVSSGAQGFKDLELVPTGMTAILPEYLARFRPGGRFGDKKRA